MRGGPVGERRGGRRGEGKVVAVVGVVIVVAVAVAISSSSSSSPTSARHDRHTQLPRLYTHTYTNTHIPRSRRRGSSNSLIKRFRVSESGVLRTTDQF